MLFTVQQPGVLFTNKCLAVCRDELAVVACSALKQKYRDILSGQVEHSEHVKEVAFVSTC